MIIDNIHPFHSHTSINPLHLDLFIPDTPDMSAFIRKNPRLSGIVQAEQSRPRNEALGSPEASSSSPSTLPGCAPAVSGSPCVLASTGITSLDAVLGGGLPLGNILTIFEDFPAGSQHANFAWTAVARAFLAEGYAAMCSDWNRLEGGWLGLVSCCDAEDTLEALLASLPRKDSKNAEQKVGEETDSEIKIAWRYQAMDDFDRRPGTELRGQTGLGHSFDLGRKIGAQAAKTIIEKGRVFLCNPEREAKAQVCIYHLLLRGLETAASKHSAHGLGRILIDSFTAPGAVYHPDLHCGDANCLGPAKFVLQLSRLVEQKPIIVLLTIPASYHCSQSLGTPAIHPNWIKAIGRCSSAVLELKAFERRFGDFDGSLHIHKPLCRPLVFRPCILDTSSLGFRLKRRHFVIEKFYLPPDIENGDQASGCPSSNDASRTGPLDF
jgi:elongator complex protein 4